MDERGNVASRCAGVVAAACTQGKRRQHGKPLGVVGDDQPDTGDGKAGRSGMAERLVVLMKPGNAGGGKGPWFKTDAENGDGPEIGEPYETPARCESCGRHHMLKRRNDPDSDPGSETSPRWRR